MTDSSRPIARAGATPDAPERPVAPADDTVQPGKGSSSGHPAHLAGASDAPRGLRRWLRRPRRRHDDAAPEAAAALPDAAPVTTTPPPTASTTPTTSEMATATSGTTTSPSGAVTTAGTGTAPAGAPVATDTADAPTSTTTPGTTVDPEADRRRTRRRRVLRWTGRVVLVLLLATAVVAAVHLFRTSQAWEDRADEYLATAQGVGEDLAGTRAELAGTQSELEAIRTQLETAKARIVELADEKAQAGDDVEAQRQLVDYQERVSAAAGNVALALDQCVQGQEQLITYLEAQAAAAVADRPAPYGQAELDQYADDVENLCRTATEANVALQQELQQ